MSWGFSDTYLPDFNDHVIDASTSTAENGEKQQMDISYPTSAFIRAVKAWDQYDEPSMGITIKPVKQYVS